jgi:protocatechuate 3,4-dioxygenase alpha subunit
MELTPSQTVGPYYDLGLIDARWAPPIEAATPSQRIRIEGRVLDGEGAPVVDGMLESWQADSGGIYRDPRATAGHALANDGFTGFQRISTAPEGMFGWETIMPGAVIQPDGSRHAPHINLGVFARGLLNRLHTRIYFPGEPLNESDPVLALVPPERRAGLIARTMGPGSYGFDIRLRGPGETVFFVC